MRNIFHLFIVVFLISLMLSPQKAKAEMPARAKALLSIVGYGTAGGAILGAASMAFGTSSRAIAQGASIGLYAGILFGTYVLVSHHNKGKGSYEDNSPYGESTDIYGDDYQSEGGGSGEEERSRGGFFERFESMHEKFNYQNAKGRQMPPLYLNLVQYNF